MTAQVVFHLSRNPIPVFSVSLESILSVTRSAGDARTVSGLKAEGQLWERAAEVTEVSK
jgi:hypothetical protein